MKAPAVLLTAFVALLLTSCADLPTAEEMKAEQAEYEETKQQQIADQSEFFDKNKKELYRRAELIGSWCDKPFGFEGVNTDSLYYNSSELDITAFPPDEYTSYSTSKDIVLTSWFYVGRDEVKGGYLTVNRLRACDTTNNDNACLSMDKNTLQMLLDLDYVFIDNQILYRTPTTTPGSSTFEGGYSLNSINCFDLNTEKPFYKSSMVAENSDEVSYIDNGYGSSDFSINLLTDLSTNISKERKKFVSTHFNAPY